MQIKDFTSNKHKSINPQNHRNVVFHHYSLPAFDNGKTVSNELGSTILSNKFYLNKSAILFNKLNIKFKRIWNIKNPVENSICSSEFIPLTVDESICLQDYLYYFLCSEPLTNNLLGCVSGTSNSQQRIRPEDLLKQEIALPSLDFQCHIVDILGSIDEKIENNIILISKINQYLKDLFRQYAKKCNSYKTLGSLCSLITKGTTPTTLKKSFTDKGIDFIKVECLNDNHLLEIEKVAHIDKETHELLKRSKLQYKDFLISIAGTIGRFALLPKIIKQANTNQAVAILRTKNLPQEYLYAVFNSGYCDEQIKAKTVQAVQANLSLSVIGSLEVPLIEDLDFYSILTNFYAKIENLYETNLKLQEMKKLYLKKFFG